MKIVDLTEAAESRRLDLILGNAGFDENDYDAGTAQYCGTFALLLCRMFPGATPALVVPVDEIGDWGGNCWRHATVYYDGELFDIYGASSEDQMIDNFLGHEQDDHGMYVEGAVIDITEEQLLDLIGTDEKSYSRRWYRRWEEMVRAGMMKVAGLQSSGEIGEDR